MFQWMYTGIVPQILTSSLLNAIMHIKLGIKGNINTQNGILISFIKFRMSCKIMS